MAKNKSKNYRLKSTIILFIVLIILALIYYYVLPNLLKNENSNATTLKLDIEGEMSGDGSLKLHMISVGQADSIFIEFPTGNTMLIDAGEKKTADTVVNYIKNLGYSSLDYVLLTHQDSDHAGGMVAVYDAFDVGYSLRPSCYSKHKNASNLSKNFNIGSSEEGFYQSTSATYYNYLEAVQNEGTEWSAFNKDTYLNFNYTFEEVLYECKLDFLTPTASLDQIKYEKSNNFSPIILLEYSGKKILLTGDAEKETEEEFLSFYEKEDFDVDVLKVGHHGSKTSSTSSFINKIMPEYSLISCGYNPQNSKFCPWQVTLDTLVEYNSAIYRTDLQGNILLTVNKNGELSINTEKECDDYNKILTGYSK